MGPVKAESSDAVATQNVPRKKTLPAFIRKLWIIFMDSGNSHLAHWSNDGRIICIPNATQFSANVLPRYFKHNNWPSFVRQLNLYGFRKVCETNIDSCKWRSEQEWQFKHDYFRKGAPQLLVNIERRIPGHRSSSVCENSQSSETPEVTPAIPESNPGTTNCQSPLESIRRLESLVKSLEQKSMLLYNHVGQIRTLYTHQNQTLADLIEKVEDTFTSREARDPTMSGPRKVPNAGSDASLSSQSMAADTTYMHCRQYPEWRCDDQTKTYPHDIPFLTSKSSVPNRAGADRDLPPAFLTPDGRSILAAAAGDQSSNHHLLAFGQQPPSSSCV